VDLFPVPFALLTLWPLSSADAQPTDAEREVWEQVDVVLKDAKGILDELQAYKGAGQEIREVQRGHISRGGTEKASQGCCLGSEGEGSSFTGFVRSWKTWKSHGILKWSIPGLEKSWKKLKSSTFWKSHGNLL